MNSGSLESFQVCWRCGCSPKACQIRSTADCVRPTSRAIERVDQCVASLGVASKVLTITSSTCSSVMVRGRPGRGSSVNPSRRCSTNRERHLPATLRWIPNSRAISVLLRPSAANNTTRDRSANACALVRRRVHDSSWDRSAADNSTGSSTEEGMITPSPHAHELTHHDTRFFMAVPSSLGSTSQLATLAMRVDEAMGSPPTNFYELRDNLSGAARRC